MSAYDYRKNVEESPHYNPSWARPVKGYRAQRWHYLSTPDTSDMVNNGDVFHFRREVLQGRIWLGMIIENRVRGTVFWKLSKGRN